MESSADSGLRNPITGIPDCCACATSGHAATPPSPAMKSRRRILESSPYVPEPIAGEVVRELWLALLPGSLHCISPEVAHRVVATIWFMSAAGGSRHGGHSEVGRL